MNKVKRMIERDGFDPYSSGGPVMVYVGRLFRQGFDPVQAYEEYIRPVLEAHKDSKIGDHICLESDGNGNYWSRKREG